MVLVSPRSRPFDVVVGVYYLFYLFLDHRCRTKSLPTLLRRNPGPMWSRFRRSSVAIYIKKLFLRINTQWTH